MWKHRIAYVCLWCSAFLLYIFYVGYLSWFLFLVVSSLPLFSLVYLWIGKQRISISLSFDKEAYQREEKVELSIHTKTHRLLPVGRIQARLNIHNCFQNETSEEPFWFASEHQLTTYQKTIKLEACGKYTVQLHHAVAYDFLGLFSCKIKTTAKTFCYCLPLPQYNEFELPDVQGEEASYDPFKKGSDPSETVGVHPYQPGDSLHALHWKLSAKMDTYMVREFASYQRLNTAICFSFYGSFYDAQTILSYVYGGSLKILEMGSLHELRQYEKDTVIFRRTISSKETLTQAMYHILDHPICFGKAMDQPTWSDSHALVVDASGIFTSRKGVS